MPIDPGLEPTISALTPRIVARMGDRRPGARLLNPANASQPISAAFQRHKCRGAGAVAIEGRNGASERATLTLSNGT